ncbi:MAG: hypothetical protein JG781_350 [Peptococcaceae bacterium]|jgi:hypothetical protein|nr:hypothetical protein [Peptococcaceae bacterium]
MSNLFYDLLLWTVPLVITFYTLSYAWWLWQQKQKRGAVGVAALALITALYPGFVLFFIHK